MRFRRVISLGVASCISTLYCMSHGRVILVFGIGSIFIGQRHRVVIRKQKSPSPNPGDSRFPCAALYKPDTEAEQNRSPRSQRPLRIRRGLVVFQLSPFHITCPVQTSRAIFLLRAGRVLLRPRELTRPSRAPLQWRADPLSALNQP